MELGSLSSVVAKSTYNYLDFDWPYNYYSDLQEKESVVLKGALYQNDTLMYQQAQFFH